MTAVPPAGRATAAVSCLAAQRPVRSLSGGVRENVRGGRSPKLLPPARGRILELRWKRRHRPPAPLVDVALPPRDPDLAVQIKHEHPTRYQRRQHLAVQPRAAGMVACMLCRGVSHCERRAAHRRFSAQMHPMSTPALRWAAGSRPFGPARPGNSSRCGSSSSRTRSCFCSPDPCSNS